MTVTSVDPKSRKKIIIIGAGSIGRRHATNLAILGTDVSVFDVNQTLLKTICADNNWDPVYDLDLALDQNLFDAAIICTPNHLHIPYAQKAIDAGLHIFIEKPLSSILSGVDDLLQIQKKHKTLIMVGYNLRFHPPLQILKQCVGEGKIGKLISIRAEVGQYLPEWRPGTDYRSSVSARSELGGGAVLELSHELDYALWLAGDVTSVTAQTDRLSDLEMDVEDTAEIILKFASGALGSIHLDMVQRPSTRYCKVLGTDGTIIWDGTTDSVMLFSNETGHWSTLHDAQKVDWNQMYISELEHFFACIRERKEPLITGSDGKRVLQIALAALQSSSEQRSITL
jgi:predicted dehydrogenase